MHPRAFALCLLAGANVGAAPLDALLSANPAGAPLRPQLEVGYDLANKSVDVLGLRPKRADGSYGPSGDYNGGHLRLGMALSPSLWVDGGLWSRKIDYASVSANITSWQLAGQVRLREGGADGISLALRAGAWGNSAPELRRTSSAVINGTTFTSARESRPRDQQWQLDFIASWPVTETITLSGFLGGGHSQVNFDQVSATSQSGNGCSFDLQFTDTAVIGTCERNGTSIRIAVPNAVYGIDVNQEARYSASFVNAGINAAWQPGAWRVRLGVQRIALDRGTLDDIVQSRGGTPYKSNLLIVTDVGYHLFPSALVFLRAQVMGNQFVGEAPLTYNSLTATQHRRRYGFLSLGLVWDF